MSYKDKQCEGCVGVKNECVMPISLEYEEVTFNCSCIDCVIKVLCREDCVLYKRYLGMAKLELNKKHPKALTFIDTVVFINGNGYYRNFLSEFDYPWWDKAGRKGIKRIK
jgi:hypothetical protein